MALSTEAATTDNIHLKFSIMTKAEIVSKISERTGIERSAVLACTEAFMDVVKDVMKHGENIYLRGFGTFLIKKRAAKKARNISKGESVFVEAHSVPAFKPSPDFKNLVR